MSRAELDIPSLELEPAEWEAQLARLLDSHHFRHSQRYPALLRYLVEQAQQGRAPLLKERLLGIEVFHRAPDYDTNVDPVVRVTAAEIRKRIAQYYQEPGHESELRIELPTGSYIPRFVRPNPPVTSGGSSVDVTRPRPAEATAESAAGANGPATGAPAAAPGASGGPGAASATSLPEDHLGKASSHPETAPLAGQIAAGPDGKPSQAVPAGRWLLRTGKSPYLWVPLLLLLGAALAWLSLQLPGVLAARREHALRAFWQPMVSADTPVFLVVGDHTVGIKGNALRAEQGLPADPAEAVLQSMNEREQITFSDIDSLFKVTNYLTTHGYPFRARGAGSVDLAELRDGPVLLYTGLNNRWTMRLDRSLPFSFVDLPDDTVGVIAESREPSHAWRVDFKVPVNSMPLDYAIVARYVDPTIEQPVIIIAGAGATGTVAASEFSTSEHMLEEMDRLAPPGWNPHSGNLEVVLGMQVIDGHAGPAHIVASRFW